MSMSVAAMKEIIMETPTAFDAVYLDVLESSVCTHEAGEERYAHNDMTDLGGDVEHVNYYCVRCGARTRTEY